MCVMRPIHFILAFILTQEAFAAQIERTGVKASSAMDNYPASKASDGTVSDASRRVSRKSDKPTWLEISLGATQKLAGVQVFFGHWKESPVIEL